MESKAVLINGTRAKVQAALESRLDLDNDAYGNIPETP
jgi:hypothetical protein